VTDVEFSSVAPVVPVRDLDAALDRYHRLGFETSAYSGPERYGYASRGGVSLHLSEEPGHDPHRTTGSVYVYVSDADAVHAEWRAAGVDGRFVAPHDTPYRLREFAYVDPDGTALRVGSPLAAPAGS
jgi:catechol 2,3-dioxygenase-like lactoylglutathione lyase family enzyme